jgi:hypothetical protein
MSEPIVIAVELGDLSVEAPDKAFIASNELLNALVREPAEAWQALAAAFGHIVSTDSLSVGEDGRIAIRDKEVFAKVKDVIGNPIGADGNLLALCINVICADEV